MTVAPQQSKTVTHWQEILQKNEKDKKLLEHFQNELGKNSFTNKIAHAAVWDAVKMIEMVLYQEKVRISAEIELAELRSNHSDIEDGFLYF